jgi:hypothetical protein
MIAIVVVLVIAAPLAVCVWYVKRVGRDGIYPWVDPVGPADEGDIWVPRELHQPHGPLTTSLFYDPPHRPLGPSTPGDGTSQDRPG